MNKKILFLLVMLSGAMLSPGIAEAALAVGTATNLSATKNVSYTQATSVTIRWAMNWSGALPVTVSSPSGSFYDGSCTVTTLLGTVSKMLSKSSAVATSSFNFTETVRIPRDVLFKAYNQGYRQICYRRVFDDGAGPLPITMVYTLTGSAGGAFGISDYSLRFGDGSVATIIQQQQPLTAEARMNISGVGLLKGVWEVATPGSTSGTPFYSSLQMVTRQVSGGQTLRVKSPLLPNSQTGTYLVRFRLLQPGLSENPPTLQYFVGPRSQVKLETIGSTSPASNAVVDASTRFEWQAVANAASYKIEIVADQRPDPSLPVEPVTGLLIKAARPQATLNASLMKKLRPNSKYWWHVLAFDSSGKMIAASDWRLLRTN